MELPPLSKEDYFVVVFEYRYGSFGVLSKIFTNYGEALKNRASRDFDVTDSFLRGFATEQEAQNFINAHSSIVRYRG